MPRIQKYSRKRMGKTSKRLSSRKRKQVTFYATKKITKRERVSFTTKSGKHVDFVAKKEVPSRIKVKFYAKKHRRLHSPEIAS